MFNAEFRMNAAILSKIKHVSLMCLCVCMIIDLGTWGDMVQIFNFLLENMCALFLIKYHKSVWLNKRNYFIQVQN